VTAAADATRPGTKLREPVLAVAAVLLIAAVAFAAWSGWSWASAPRVSGHATARDAALRAGEQAVLNFNTLDYHQASAGLNLWLASSTGTLHSQLSQDMKQEVQLVQGKKTITTAKILDGAVTQLDTTGGTASVMVAVDVTVTPAKGSPFTERESEIGQVSRTATGWKLSSLGYPAASSGSSAASGSSASSGSSLSPSPSSSASSSPSAS
jgi:Mce-associated membrane protein